MDFHFRIQVKDDEAIRGFAFIAECRQRRLKGEGDEEFLSLGDKDKNDSEWAKGEKVRLLLEWSRLVCAHYGNEVGQGRKNTSQTGLFFFNERSTTTWQVENLTVSFSDGRALCFLLHHYYPQFLPRRDILESTTSSRRETAFNPDASLDDSFGATMTYNLGGGDKDREAYEKLLANERHNFRVFHSKVSHEQDLLETRSSEEFA